MKKLIHIFKHIINVNTGFFNFLCLDLHLKHFVLKPLFFRLRQCDRMNFKIFQDTTFAQQSLNQINLI